MKKFLFVVVLWLFSVQVQASIDTIAVSSKSMRKNVKCVVVTPANYKSGNQRYPVVYLLHGAGGSYNNWARRVPDLQQLADQNNLMIVCPDGLVTSWYFDSPIDSTIRYETNVGTEIPEYIDANYRTIADRKARAITGLSMGGHGGMFLAFRHADRFGACGSMSGALDVSRITRGYGMDKLLGDTIANQKYYHDWSVVNLVEHYPKDSLAIIIDCGTEDFIYPMTKATHEKMLQLKIPHDYIERPGKHDWPYWNKAVRYQLLFFKEYFRKNGY
ncbi:esterase family protein [Segetibacter sp. 3557_3]|uniref:alpha/beta hydrolase n=1 Tax=Segetibacter sp. 3557_3 TaxID=2547429 RepID=UPI001058D8BB|nr:alpha/beta hydrolase family protein [Segetibacter sp. 3557_3]TDH29036.1 esterase family protein [Segetibacter sp. 3557_3]